VHGLGRSKLGKIAVRRGVGTGEGVRLLKSCGEFEDGNASARAGLIGL